jgi:hypothetical protein
MKRKRIVIIGSLISILFLIFVRFSSAPAISQDSSSRTVNAKVRLSVCGDWVAEGGEDCDNNDLAGKTCINLEYASGDLACDIACSFDTSNCISPTPTPTPTSTPTPTPTITPSPTATPTPTTAVLTVSTSEIIPTSSPTLTTVKSVTPTVFQSPIIEPALPIFLIPFDSDGDGKITIKEIFIVAKSWVEDWRQAMLEEIAQGEGVILTKKERKCDLNKDYRCDLKDFSILLFYVER